MRITFGSSDWLHVPIPPDEAAHDRLRPHRARSIRPWCGSRPRAASSASARPRPRSAAPAPTPRSCACIEQELAPLIVGEDARDISRLWDVMYNGSRAHFALARGHAFPVLGRRGLTVVRDQRHRHGALGHARQIARACRSGACSAAGGTHACRPTRRAAGRRPIGSRPSCRASSRAATSRRSRCGSAPATARSTTRSGACARRARVSATRVDIMCDAHGTWTVAEAKRFCREVADCNLGWLEEPVCADDKRGQAEVRAATDIPIASGESEFTRFDFRDLIELRAVDILQPDLSIAGGITEAHADRGAGQRPSAPLRAPSLGRRFDLRRRPARRRGRLQRLHPRVLARRQPDAARARARGLPGGRRP